MIARNPDVHKINSTRLHSLDHLSHTSLRWATPLPCPPCVHQCHSRDGCSQAFPVFHALPLPCYITERKPKNKKWGKPRSEASDIARTSTSTPKSWINRMKSVSYHSSPPSKMYPSVWHSFAFVNSPIFTSLSVVSSAIDL